MKNKFLSYLSKEVAIEYKACLYFCCILFFYFAYLLYNGLYSASIPFMFEMILTAYFVGYLQVYLLQNFDEAEQLGKREAVKIVLCSDIYTVVSIGFGWFEGELFATVFFYGYLVLCYLCVYLCNRIKRKIDTDRLNMMLTAYKKGGN